VTLAMPPSSCKVYTPRELAEAMSCALGDEGHFTWLEPSHGKGAFLEAISRLGVQKQRIVAVDLDRKESNADELATTLRGVDFLRWAYETQLRFDRIVGNPPYVAIRRLPKSLQRSAASVMDMNGRPIGRGANTWYAFVLASISLLRKGGSLAFVLPSAAEFADYSAAIREGLHETFGSLELYRCERPLFADVQEGTLVAVARHYGLGPCNVRRLRFQSPKGLLQGLAGSGRIAGHPCPRGPIRSMRSSVTLDSIADVRLGGVTGDARYFLMTEEQRRSLELPRYAVRPVVSKAKHLRSSFIDDAAWQALKQAGERIWLFRPSAQAAKAPKVRRYLTLAQCEGGCNRTAYKIANRDPWYQTPLPSKPDAFLSGMSRYGPVLCINEMPGLCATNTLYVLTFRNRDRNAWYRWALSLLSSTAQRQIRRIGRRYADGLVKYEPGSLGKINLPRMRDDLDCKTLYVRALQALHEGKHVGPIADSAVAVD
jgi:adenine-specific DNA-methyltransferase